MMALFIVATSFGNLQKWNILWDYLNTPNFSGSNLKLISAALLSASIFSQTKNPYKTLNSLWKSSEVNTYREKKR